MRYRRGVAGEAEPRAGSWWRALRSRGTAAPIRPEIAILPPTTPIEPVIVVGSAKISRHGAEM